MKHWVPFAVGAFMLTRRDKFEEYGGFPAKYETSEDFFLSKQYSPKKFKIAKHYFGQDSRRFKKMGYFGMSWYLIKNFLILLPAFYLIAAGGIYYEHRGFSLAILTVIFLLNIIYCPILN